MSARRLGFICFDTSDSIIHKNYPVNCRNDRWGRFGLGAIGGCREGHSLAVQSFRKSLAGWSEDETESACAATEPGRVLESEIENLSCRGSARGPEDQLVGSVVSLVIGKRAGFLNAPSEAIARQTRGLLKFKLRARTGEAEEVGGDARVAGLLQISRIKWRDGSRRGRCEWSCGRRKIRAEECSRFQSFN